MYVAMTCIFFWNHLSRSKVCKHFQQLDSFLYGADRLKPGVDRILYHNFEVLEARSELVVILMPGGGFNVQDSLANSFQAGERLLKYALNLSYVLRDFWSPTPTEAGNGMLLTLVAPCKVDLYNIHNGGKQSKFKLWCVTIAIY